MRRLVVSILLVVALFGLGLPASVRAAGLPSSPQTYTVLVGYENTSRAFDLMGFYPSSVTIHEGDTVHWVINSNEIHTVSFGYVNDGTPLPDLIVPAAVLGYPTDPGPLVLSPDAIAQVPMGGGMYVDKANSGIMGRAPGQVQTFDLTFDAAGDYLYVCLVHGWAMSGMVHVVAADTPIPSPNKAAASGRREIAAGLAQVPAAMAAARQMIEAPTDNGDGTMTYHVMVGYHQGQVDLMGFFPNKLVVRPGDKVEWLLSDSNMAPHTVTFLNGAAGPEDFLPVDVGGGVVALYLNPQVLFPSQNGTTLTRDGFFNSGVLQPGGSTSYTFTIGGMKPGRLPYECLLHDASGMTGTLVIAPR